MNTAIDYTGKEVPIRYKASDLVNKSAPDGYIWEKHNEYYEYADSVPIGQTYRTWEGPASQYDYYICVKIPS